MVVRSLLARPALRSSSAFGDSYSRKTNPCMDPDRALRPLARLLTRSLAVCVRCWCVRRLLACIAPRPVYVHSGADDTWADGYGEYLGAHHACPAFNLLGASTALRAARPPQLGEPVVEGAVGYHCREGGHSIEDWDWERYMDFADSHLKSG